MSDPGECGFIRKSVKILLANVFTADKNTHITKFLQPASFAVFIGASRGYRDKDFRMEARRWALRQGLFYRFF